MNLNELAGRIQAHLTRFERDPEVNATRFYDRTMPDGTKQRESMGRPYYGTRAMRAGRYVRVIYITYQGGTNMPREKAERYLAWLDEGNVGTHYEAGIYT